MHGLPSLVCGRIFLQRERSSKPRQRERTGCSLRNIESPRRPRREQTRPGGTGGKACRRGLQDKVFTVELASLMNMVLRPPAESPKTICGDVRCLRLPPLHNRVQRTTANMSRRRTPHAGGCPDDRVYFPTNILTFLRLPHPGCSRFASPCKHGFSATKN